MNVAALSPKKKLDYLRECIIQVRECSAKEILCPYCGEINAQENELLCCPTFMEAMDAVMTRLEEEEKIHFITHVYDKAQVN
jgi:hypothetical protein